MLIGQSGWDAGDLHQLPNRTKWLFVEGILNCTIDNGPRVFVGVFEGNPAYASLPEISGDCRGSNRIHAQHINKFSAEVFSE
jgi:hypothetical protein